MKFAPNNWWFRGKILCLSVSFREVDEKLTSWFTDWSENISSNISIWPYSLVWTIYFSRWKRSNPNWFWCDDASSDHRLKGRHRWFLGNHRNHHEPIVSLLRRSFGGLTGKYQRYWINGSLQPTKTPEELQLLVDLTTNGGSDCESQKLKLHDAPCCSPFGVPIFFRCL